MYDGSGRRVAKRVMPKDASGVPLGDNSVEWTFYVRDVSGNVMGVYSFDNTPTVSGHTASLKLEEHAMMGAKTLGQRQPDIALRDEFYNTSGNLLWVNLYANPSGNTFTRIAGQKHFALTDHLGNVRSVFNDVKEPTSFTFDGLPTAFEANIEVANNYYAFGMLQPGRTFANADYRYGFNGMEKDDEVAGVGNSYTTAFRQLDPRLGRWFSLDPMMAKYPHQSPYASFNNNPIYFSDPTGLEGDPPSEELSAENQAFFTSAKSYIDSEIEKYKGYIAAREASFKKKNWAIDKSTGKFKAWGDRIAQLETAKTDIEAIETAVKANGGDDLLTLTNVIYNEAGNFGTSAQEAVGYAYMNRIGADANGDIREPEGDSEISHYSELGDRWDGYSSDSEKLTFLGGIRQAYNSAATAYAGGTDPTGGATHWVSPQGLDRVTDASVSRAGYYQRTYSGTTRYFPTWARSNSWVTKNQTTAKKWFNVSEYEEKTVDGVPGNQFLFYTGVKY